MRKLLVTGAAGFIGSNFVRHWFEKHSDLIVMLDALTYAGNLRNLDSVMSERVKFFHGNICDSRLVSELLEKFEIDIIVNFAAESHVDRSISGPATFIETNINGTFSLLECARKTWKTYEGKRFHQISTDEVYGQLELTDAPFTEKVAYNPRSPYSASKAASDMLVRAYGNTYGLPFTISNCSNNYGPYHFPEKLIPLVIINCLTGKSIPVYGVGLNIRDWIHVFDHCSAIEAILLNGKAGETYNVGGECEITNLDLVKEICTQMDELFLKRPNLKSTFSSCPPSEGRSCHDLITFVADRPGHDKRYAIDNTKVFSELGFKPSVSIEHGIRTTIEWYLANQTWWGAILSGEYRNWVENHYEKTGLKK